MDMVSNTTKKKPSIFCLILNVLVCVFSSKGMWAVKVCSNKILQFLAVGAS